MTEQDKPNDSKDEAGKPAEGEAKDSAPPKAEAKDAAPPKAEAKDATPPKAEAKDSAPPKAEAKDAAPAKAEKKPAAPAKAEKKPREIAPAGPSTAVVIPEHAPGTPIVSRRTVLQIGFWAGLGGVMAGIGACSLDLIYPASVAGFGGTVSVGEELIPKPGEKTVIGEGRFWLVNLTEEQGGPGLLALWWKCPHLGCTVPWKPGFIWPDPATGADKRGWFRCPCHGSTYTDAGIRTFGPAPRSMDTMAITVDNGRITVDTGDVTPGDPENANRAVRL